MENLSSLLNWGANAILVYVTGSFFKHMYDTYKEKKSINKDKE